MRTVSRPCKLLRHRSNDGRAGHAAFGRHRRWRSRRQPAAPQGRGRGRRRRVREPLPFEYHEGFDSIFDGKTLKGWDGDPRFWRVRERRDRRPDDARQEARGEHVHHLAGRRTGRLRAEGRVPHQRHQQRHPDPQRAAAAGHAGSPGPAGHRQVGDEGLPGRHRLRQPVHRPDLRGARPRLSRDARTDDLRSARRLNPEIIGSLQTARRPERDHQERTTGTRRSSSRAATASSRS